MLFRVTSKFSRPTYGSKSIVYLRSDDWNDFNFHTLYELTYVDGNGNIHEVGAVKIGFYGQKEGQRSLEFKDFEYIGDQSFSLGQDDRYYENLNSFGAGTRDEILFALNDIAKSPDKYTQAIKENVTLISLMRYINEGTVTVQFRRIADGLARLTAYYFSYTAPKGNDAFSEMKLSFEVFPDSHPPTNIHVIIGRNGVGKTNLINNIIHCLKLGNEPANGYGSFSYNQPNVKQGLFTGLTLVSFSAFDSKPIPGDGKFAYSDILFNYIGLRVNTSETENRLVLKANDELRKEFVMSHWMCLKNLRTKQWSQAISFLESDPNFKEANVTALNKHTYQGEHDEEASKLFDSLSSGHKIILLTITKLLETLQEKSLVLIDEPESHLHPPLLAAFTRAFSQLLIDKNAVAIVATHSPVVLQEVPRNCVWKLSRYGNQAKAERLEVESFGENVGTLTREVFGLEVTESGFYSLLKQASQETDSYETLLEAFKDQLGMEGRSIARTLLHNKKNQENNDLNQAT